MQYIITDLDIFQTLAIDYVNYLQRDRQRKNQEIAELEKKLAALKIMKE